MRRHTQAPAMTVGVLRPRVLIHDDLIESLDAPALRAVRAHEEAHARARDPLRIWLAQFATDMQWPIPGAACRLYAWRNALEVARDDDARRCGIDGVDLVAALVAAARLSSGGPEGMAATAVGNGSFLRERIARLLSPIPPPPPVNGWWSKLAVLGFLLACGGAGLVWGDAVIPLLPGVLR
ncbi:M48 family metalloprotease [Pyxidicoccus parkwayensis]|nr:M48 family metalloprotease [Pyxidicoccus parkwaysis]